MTLKNILIVSIPALLVLSLVSLPGASAQIVDPIVVTTDKLSYVGGDTILISGEVRELLSGFPVSLQVLAPNGNIIVLLQLEVSDAKTFSTTVSDTTGGLWKSSGTYTVKVMYGTESRTAETTFVFNDVPETEVSYPDFRVEMRLDNTIQKLERDFIFIDFDFGKIDDYFSSANILEERLKSISFPTNRYTIKNIPTYENKELVLTKKITIDIESSKEYNDIFDKNLFDVKPSAFSVKFGDKIIDENTIDAYIISACKQNSNAIYCQKTHSVKSKIFDNIGKHTISESLVLIKNPKEIKGIFSDESFVTSLLETKAKNNEFVSTSDYSLPNLPPTKIIAKNNLILPVFASHSNTVISAPPGSSVPGCDATNECYIPDDITINVGETVTWSNDDTAAHTVTSGSPATGPTGKFDSSLFMAGTTFDHTFDEAGDYPYFCMVHPWMIGIVTVLGQGSGGGDSGPTTGSIKVSGTSYYLDYSISGATISRAFTDNDANSLILSLSASNDGVLTITIPRDLLDAKDGNSDDDFFVLVNAEEIAFNEISTSSNDRTLTIDFASRADEIEIIGSQILSSSPSPSNTLQESQKVLNYLNGFTKGFGAGKTWTYEYKESGLQILFVEAHIEGGLGVGLRIPIDVTVEMQEVSSSGTQHDVSYKVLTKNLDESGYKKLGLADWKLFEGYEFNTYVGPAGYIQVDFLGWTVFEPSFGTPKAEGKHFIPPLGANKKEPFSKLGIDFCDFEVVPCLPDWLAKMELLVGVRGDLSADKITLDSTSRGSGQDYLGITFTNNGERKDSLHTISSPGNDVKNVEYHSNLNFIGVIDVKLESPFIPFYKIDESFELPGIKFTNVVLGGHNGTDKTYIIPEFGAITIMMLGIAIAIIIAVMARSKVVTRLDPL